MNGQKNSLFQILVKIIFFVTVGPVLLVLIPFPYNLLAFLLLIMLLASLKGAGRAFGSSSYQHLLAWIKMRYGQPPSTSYELDNFMQNVLLNEKSKVGDRKIAGLKKYVEERKYSGLIKN